MLQDTLIFALTRSKTLAKEVCEILNLEEGLVEVNSFADGETLIEIGQSVRGKNVYIIQSTCSPVNESYMELLIMIDACKRAKIGRAHV
jgi:ribose-phosphate pyrophosphokinase